MANNEKLENKELEQVNGGYGLPDDQFMLIFGCAKAASAQPNDPAREVTMLFTAPDSPHRE